MTSLPPATWPLFDDLNLAHLATVMPDGTPQVSPVWVERDGNRAVIVNTARGRVKHRNLVRNPAVALAIHDCADLYHYVQIRGRAELVDDPDRTVINRLSRKYRGVDFPERPGEHRVTVRILATSVDHHPPR